MKPPSKLFIPLIRLAATVGLIEHKLAPSLSKEYLRILNQHPIPAENVEVKEYERQVTPALIKLRLNLLSYAARHDGHFPASLEMVMHGDWLATVKPDIRGHFLKTLSYARKLTPQSRSDYILLASPVPSHEGRQIDMQLDGTVSLGFHE